MKNLIESIRVQIYERLTSPLFGSFVVAWICWNYRFIAIVFSSIPIEQRFSLVDTKVFPSWIEISCHGIVGPISTAVLFILLYPRISKFFFEEWLKKQVETKELRDKIERAAMLTVEESQKILTRLVKAKDEYSQLLKEKDDEIAALKTHIDSLSKGLNRPNQLDEVKKMLEEYNSTKSTDTHFINAIRFIIDEKRAQGLKNLIENTVGPLDKAIPLIFKSKTFDEFIANSGIDLEIIENLNIKEVTDKFPDSVFSASSFGVQALGRYKQAEMLFAKNRIVKMNPAAKSHFDYLYHTLKTEIGH